MKRPDFLKPITSLFKLLNLNSQDARGNPHLTWGFTLIEMMLVLFITITIATVSIYSLRGGSAQGALARSAARVALDLRRAQNLALTSLVYQGSAVYGFGIYFTTTTPNEYILFADQNGNDSYDGVAEQAELIKLESNVVISSLVPGSPIIIVFRSPEPTTTIKNGAVQITSATITLAHQIETSLAAKQIFINNFGLVEQL